MGLRLTVVILIALVIVLASKAALGGGITDTGNGVDEILQAGRLVVVALPAFPAAFFLICVALQAINRVWLGPKAILAPPTFATPLLLSTERQQVPPPHQARLESPAETMSRHASDATPLIVGVVLGTATVLGLLVASGETTLSLVTAGAAGQVGGFTLWFLFCEVWVARWEKRNTALLLRIVSRGRGDVLYAKDLSLDRSE